MNNIYTVLGAGIAGLSSSYHLGHENCIIFEKNNYHGGHIHSEKFNGFTWDEGPHVSFTKNEYVKNLFAESVNNNFIEHEVYTVNYYKGNWIPHPAQSNFWAITDPLRSECINSFIQQRECVEETIPNNYEQWLKKAFGEKFAEEFPCKYTWKYWATKPEKMSTEWIGKRVFYPSQKDVIEGSKGPLPNQTHYITQARYPIKGGYFSFSDKIRENANIWFNKKIVKISLKERRLFFENNDYIQYEKLINTIPLPEFIEMSDVSQEIKHKAKELNYTSLLLVNVIANHETIRSENWIYVYDEDKYSTRINCTDLLSPENGIKGKTGIQVEVYFSRDKKKEISDDEIAKKVITELVEMSLIKSADLVESYFTKWLPWANIIFDLNTRNNLNIVLNELTNYGMNREYDDLEPMTEWDEKFNRKECLCDIILAGRFGQWKYYWTDDCVLRGKYLQTE